MNAPLGFSPELNHGLVRVDKPTLEDRSWPEGRAFAVDSGNRDFNKEELAPYDDTQPDYTLPSAQRTVGGFKDVQWETTAPPSFYGGAMPKLWAEGGPGDELKAYYDKYQSGGQQSHTIRKVKMRIKDKEDERFVLACSVSCSVLEVREFIAAMTGVQHDSFKVWRDSGQRLTQQIYDEEIASNVVLTDIETFKPKVEEKKKKYEHPIFIMGAGLGGLQTAVTLQKHGFEDIQLFDRCSDFGGASWICVSNRFTKLQTEKSTYFVDYITPEEKTPSTFDPGDGEAVPYKIWPSRDQLLTMFRASGTKHGLRAKTHFNTSIEKIQVKDLKRNKEGIVEAKPRSYVLHTVPCRIDFDDKSKYIHTGDAEICVGSALVCWPGNLTKLNLIDFPGEDTFDGYIQYSSFDMFDYQEVKEKKVILYGHGAFVIENVRTLLEHQAAKVYVMCRRRNICGMRAISWWVSSEDVAVPGHIMLNAMQKIYDLVNFDVWSAYSVKTDSKRSFAFIDQKTVFGVTDVYFLAGYYGLMEVIVDEIKRLSRHCAHCLKSGRKLTDISVICKAIGTAASSKCDKLLNLKELKGMWVNGDPLMPVSTNGMFVSARNFGAFSSGPGFVGIVVSFVWFIRFQEDWQHVAKAMPTQRAVAGEPPAHIGKSNHIFVTFLTMAGIPGLAYEQAVVNSLKAIKTQEALPAKEYLGACRAEWEMYIKNWKTHGMIDDSKEEPPYPYTEEVMADFKEQARAHAEAAAAPKE